MNLTLHCIDGAYYTRHTVTETKRILESHAALIAACEAALRYDAAIESCANEPEKMASFCTAEGDDLDALYADWMTKARAALTVAKVLT